MDENLKYWLALNKIPNLGPVTIKKLWEHFGNIRAVWQAKAEEIWEVEGLNRSAGKAFLEHRDQVDLEDELAMVEKEGITVVTLEDENYPKNLKQIYDPPPVLFVKGKFEFERKAVAIVGTRKASHYGLEMSKKLAEGLASVGVVVVSGLALGIDTAAHEGALAANGKTIAVLGSGLDVIYPPQNRGLAEKIWKSGCLLSEFPLGTKSEKGNFPRRNRIISGLSLGVIVVEGQYDSGAMITAKLALEQGREVFAVPGNVQREQAKGPHWLIKQGAKLVETVEDVLEELKFQLPTTLPSSISASQVLEVKPTPLPLLPEEQKIVSLLSQEPKHLDAIAAESGLSVPQVSSLLMMLELKNIVRQLPGKFFVISH
jgi:DNA processing protein